MKLQQLAMAAALGISAVGGAIAQGGSPKDATETTKPKLNPEYMKLESFSEFRQKV